LILDTVSEPMMATQLLSAPNAIPYGPEPTGTVAVTVSDAGSIFDTVFQ